MLENTSFNKEIFAEILTSTKILDQGSRYLEWGSDIFPSRMNNFCPNLLVLFKFVKECKDEENLTKCNCRQQKWSSITLQPRAGIFTYAVRSPVQFPFLLLTIWTWVSQVSELIRMLCGLPSGGKLRPSSTLSSFPLRVMFYVG